MREIKFRAWSKEQQLMSIPLTIRHIARWADDSMRYFKGYGIKYDELIFLQYIGLKDRSGKEIYEGDVLQMGKEKQVIEFNSNTYADGGGQSYYVSYHWGYHLYSQNYTVFDPEQCEIIGNIYENPELIKQSNEA